MGTLTRQTTSSPIPSERSSPGLRKAPVGTVGDRPPRGSIPSAHRPNGRSSVIVTSFTRAHKTSSSGTGRKRVSPDARDPSRIQIRPCVRAARGSRCRQRWHGIAPLLQLAAARVEGGRPCTASVNRWSRAAAGLDAARCGIAAEPGDEPQLIPGSAGRRHLRLHRHDLKRGRRPSVAASSRLPATRCGSRTVRPSPA